MREAVGVSQGGFPAPNPHVGCVIGQGDKIVGKGFHDFAGGPHAEINALIEAGDLARGGTAYVTMEPCNHHGRTGPCTKALIEAGISRVVYLIADPNSRAKGGAERLREAGIEVEGPGWSLDVDNAHVVDLARSYNEVWLTAMKLRRPYVTLKAAIGMDGRLALADGRSKWITGEKSRAAGLRLRAEMGCVLVGGRTIINDDPRLTARVRGLVNPVTRVIMAEGGLSLDDRRLLEEPGEIIFVPEDATRALEILWDRGITSLLVEGGAATHSRFLEAGLVDRIELFIAPRILGEGLPWTTANLPGDPLSPTSEWSGPHFTRLEDDVRLTYRRRVSAL